MNKTPLYSQTSIRGGKKRKKLIFFVYFLIILTIFVACLLGVRSIWELKSEYLPTTQFYCLYAPSDDIENDTKRYAARGAGAFVFDKDKIGLALFSSQSEANSVKSALTTDTDCEIWELSTPQFSTLDLSTEDIDFITQANSTIISTLHSLCSLSIQLDSLTISEAQLRSSIEQHIINTNSLLDYFLYLHPQFFDSSLPTYLKSAHDLLLHCISWLKYIVTTSSYTNNLINFPSVVRNATLNLAFEICNNS